MILDGVLSCVFVASLCTVTIAQFDGTTSPPDDEYDIDNFTNPEALNSTNLDDPKDINIDILTDPVIEVIPGQGRKWTEPTIKKKPENKIKDKVNKICGYQQQCVNVWNCKNHLRIEEKYVISFKGIHDCDHLEVCCKSEDLKSIAENPQNVIIPNDELNYGYVNDKGVYLTLEDTEWGESSFGEIPWTVSIRMRTTNLHYLQGSLIRPNVVLTVAAPLQSRQAEDLVVRAGEWDMLSEEKIQPHLEELVKEIRIHPNFNDNRLGNNIALLILESSFPLFAYIKPICPHVSQRINTNNCFVAGWNHTPRRNTRIVSIMSVNLIRCDDATHNTLLCVSSKNKNLAYATGSALVCSDSNESLNRYYQIGIWSYGMNKFTNVTVFHDWIKEFTCS